MKKTATVQQTPDNIKKRTCRMRNAMTDLKYRFFSFTVRGDTVASSGITDAIDMAE